MADLVYARLVGARLRSQLVYRASFTIDFLTQIIAQCTELVVILVLFDRIDALGGFTRDEVVLMYAFAGAAFGVADLFAGQLDNLPTYIRTGSFDVLLMRPLGTLPQIMCTDIRLRRIGRIAGALGAMGYALAHVTVEWTPAKVVLAVLTPVAGAVIFSAVWVVACSVCFWIVEGREFANAVTYGGNSFTSYPINVYSRPLRWLMAFVVPGAFVAYYPSLTLLGKQDPLGFPGWTGWTSPLVAVLAAGVAGLVWRFAVRHYRGTGS
ncbi:ABC-2 type transport system permease protein [Lentzea fradiae]|uniref:ABC-2 type transport system permease protein n=1 Tax=Lentzea fradiae TaxID=200378 RepID=A0A1G7N514_9PSEU|nr:ABC-2 family transporter protein [Lentzea fradiae]SDF69052.1 ABC-2 type transport system permease protein [Lentzea fradiae]SDF88317.1 ABC-2 type transport system permease protein [Lentzea fradiae]